MPIDLRRYEHYVGGWNPTTKGWRIDHAESLFDLSTFTLVAEVPRYSRSVKNCLIDCSFRRVDPDISDDEAIALIIHAVVLEGTNPRALKKLDRLRVEDLDRGVTREIDLRAWERGA